MGGHNVARGMYGQQLAEDWLCQKGYTIVARNFRSPHGEIDLIAKEGDCFVFVEVKYRKSLQYGYPREAVHRAKQNKIRRTAQYFIAGQSGGDWDCRFDVVEILDMGDKPIREHIENAF